MYPDIKNRMTKYRKKARNEQKKETENLYLSVYFVILL